MSSRLANATFLRRLRGILQRHLPNMECFAKKDNGLVQSAIFAKSSTLENFPVSEYVSDNIEDFSIIIN